MTPERPCRVGGGDRSSALPWAPPIAGTEGFGLGLSQVETPRQWGWQKKAFYCVSLFSCAVRLVTIKSWLCFFPRGGCVFPAFGPQLLPMVADGWSHCSEPWCSSLRHTTHDSHLPSSPTSPVGMFSKTALQGRVAPMCFCQRKRPQPPGAGLP